jgi:hypothetical protein
MTIVRLRTVKVRKVVRRVVERKELKRKELKKKEVAWKSLQMLLSGIILETLTSSVSTFLICHKYALRQAR